MTNPNNITDYAQLAGLRAVCGLLFEHPLEVAKLRNQAHPSLSHTAVVRSLYQENGIKTFYAGGIPSVMKKTFRTAYRWPTVFTLHNFWKQQLNDEGSLSTITPKLATAVSIACIETVCILPLERLFVAKVNDLGYGHFIKDSFQYQGIKSLYSGALVHFMNHNTSWMTFMMTNYLVKQVLSEVDPNNKNPIRNRLFFASLVGTSLTVVDLPMEFVKLHIQLNNSLQNVNTLQAVKQLIQTYKIRGLYTGFGFALAQKSVQTFFGSVLFEQLIR